MPTKYSFGGLGHLFKCECGCYEFIRAENVKPERIEIYECANCHEWYTANVPPNTACTGQEPAVAVENQVACGSCQ